MTMERTTSITLCLLLLSAACGSGGGGDSTTPDIPAIVPPGAGITQIDMAGTWAIQNAEVVDSNAATPSLPVDGTLFQVELTRIATIGGVSVDPAELEQLLGTPLVTYVNQVDASRVFFGALVDQRSSGGVRLETALAGGAIDADTIMVEAFTSEQSPTDPEPIFTRSRYQLVRVPGTTPLLHRPESWAAGDLSRAAFGGF